jgi:hypothetical protein
VTGALITPPGYGKEAGSSINQPKGETVSRIFMLVYLVIGVVVAAAQDYIGDIGGLGDVINLVLAILLWPLLLVGVDFNIRIGDNGDGGNGNNNVLLLAGPVLGYLGGLARRARSKLVT